MDVVLFSDILAKTVFFAMKTNCTIHCATRVCLEK